MTTTFKKIDDNKFSIQFVTSQYNSTTNIHSQKNEFGGFNWSLVTKTSTGDEKKQNLAIYLDCDGNKSNLWNVDVNADFHLKNTNGLLGKALTTNYNYKESTGWGFPEFIDISLLTSQGYIKDGCITIECVVTIKSTGGVQQKKIHNFGVKDPVLSDLMLSFNGKKLYANKAILSIHSSELRSRIYPNNGNTINELLVEQFEYDEFEQFLQCIYLAQSVNKNNVENVLKIAHRFLVHVLMDQCEKFLISSDDINKSTKLKYAETYKLSNLQAAVLDCIKDYAELKTLTSNTDNLGEPTVRALLKKLGEITV